MVNVMKTLFLSFFIAVGLTTAAYADTWGTLKWGSGA